MVKNNFYSSAYTSSTSKGLFQKTEGIAQKIKQKYTIDSFSGDIKKEENLYVLAGDDSSIPIFIHPVVFNNEVFIDARAFVTRDQKIKNIEEYKYLKKRALLDLGWNKEHEIFEGTTEFTIDVFSTWVSGNLSRALSLNMMLTQSIKIACAIYYLGLFKRDELTSSQTPSKFDFDLLAAKLIKILSRSLRIPGEMIDEFLNTYEELVPQVYFYSNNKQFETNEKLNNLCTLIFSIIEESVKINPTILYTTCCSGTFAMANSNEIAMITLEHPPYLINMMNYVLKGGFLSKLKIGIATQSVNKKHNLDIFTKSVNYFIKEGDE